MSVQFIHKTIISVFIKAKKQLELIETTTAAVKPTISDYQLLHAAVYWAGTKL